MNSTAISPPPPGKDTRADSRESVKKTNPDRRRPGWK